MMQFLGAVFDLDGVLVNTAKYHYLAWKELAKKLGFTFTPEQNERLKGVSRMDSLHFLLESGGLKGRFTQEEEERMAAWKNDRYIQYISSMDSFELLAGALELLKKLKQQGVKVALGSASKNAPLILQHTHIDTLFDAIVDGNNVTRTKPDPQVFQLAAQALNLPGKDCAIFEDAEAGLQAAKRAGMYAIGIGDPKNLPSADVVYESLAHFPYREYFGN